MFAVVSARFPLRSLSTSLTLWNCEPLSVELYSDLESCPLVMFAVVSARYLLMSVSTTLSL